MLEVSLTPSEMIVAASVGVLRRVTSLKNGITDRAYAQKRNPWQMDIEGACAEAACAKGLGIYWGAGINTFKAADIGGRLQVRSTQSRTNKLIIRDRDDDSDIFVLLVGECPSYEMIGWIAGREGKNPMWREDVNSIGKPSFFVPQENLHPIDELMKPKQGGS